MFSQNAMINLKNRYSTVLKKCHLLNTFGSLAVAGMLCVGAMGGVAVLGAQDAWAAVEDITNPPYGVYYYFDDTTGTIAVSGDLIIANGNASGARIYTATGNENYVKGKLTVGDQEMNNTTLQADGDFAIGSVAFEYMPGSTPEEDKIGTLQILSGTTTVSGITEIDNYGILIVESGASYVANEKITVKDGTLSNYGTINGTDLEFLTHSNSRDLVDYGTMNLSGTLTMNGSDKFNQATITANTLAATQQQGELATYTLTDNTTVAVNNLTGDGKFDIHSTQNHLGTAITGSMLVVGSTDYQWVGTAINEVNSAMGAGLNSDALATLALRKTYSNPLTLGNYTEKNSAGRAAYMGFGSDSLLVVDAGALGDNYALTATKTGSYLGNINVDSGAKLLVSDVSFDNASSVTVNIAKADGYLTMENGAWGYELVTNPADKIDNGLGELSSDSKGSTDTTNKIDLADSNNIYFDNALINVASYSYDMDNNTYSITVTKEEANTELPLLDKSLTAHIDKATDLSDYINKGIKIEDKTEAASTVESAAKMLIGAGVLASLNAVSELGASAVEIRSTKELSFSGVINIVQNPVMLADSSTSFTDTPMPLIDDAATGNGLVDGFALWVQPLYQSVSADGFKSGNFDYGYNTDIFGVSLGADYTTNASLRFGLAFHMGGGDTESDNSDLSYTKNDFDYYGATLYSAYVLSNFSIAADMGYIVTTNDVVQRSTIGELSTGDFNAGAFSLGTKAQYKVATSFVDIVPYLGARLNYSHVESFNTKDANGTVFHNQSLDATTFGIPLGVTFAKTMEFDDFTLTPRAKVGAQFTMGDLNVKQRVSLPNVSGHATLESEVFDPVTFMGGLGLDFGFNNMNLALEYNLGASENTLSQQVMATFNYTF